MLQHTQSHCLTCQRPTLHVRNTYDVPHVGYLIFFCALGLAAVVARDAALSGVFGFAAAGWLALWALHTVANYSTASQPFRCHQCGSPAATPAAVADATEPQRLQAAMAKAAARRGVPAIAILAIAAMPAIAQPRLARIAPATPGQDSYYAPSPSDEQSPTIYDLARQPYPQYRSYDQSCSMQRDAQYRRVVMMQERRAAEQSRRQAARERLPLPIQNDEQLAAGKFRMAHLLWQDGNMPAARKWLGDILDKFPDTETAARARQTLARL